MFRLGSWGPGRSPTRILCLGAHSDDIEIGCGGTILALLASHPGIAVRWVVFSASREREEEARQSGAAFLAQAGDREIVLWPFRDGYFPALYDQIKDEFEGLKRYQPDIIFTHYREDRHQDHRVISDLTWTTFRNHLILEYEIPKYDGDLGIPNLFVPLTAAQTAHKVHLLLTCFRSQRNRDWFDEDTFRAILRLRGMEAKAPERYAEAFYCRKMVLGWSDGGCADS